jgi:hypothetical protein
VRMAQYLPNTFPRSASNELGFKIKLSGSPSKEGLLYLSFEPHHVALHLHHPCTASQLLEIAIFSRNSHRLRRFSIQKQRRGVYCKPMNDKAIAVAGGTSRVALDGGPETR